MNEILHINYVLIWIFAALTLFGLYRPWLALWWLPMSNRKMVLERYGLITLGLWTVYVVVSRLYSK